MLIWRVLGNLPRIDTKSNLSADMVMQLHDEYKL